MTHVVITGQLVCADLREADIVTQHLDQHVALTRAEPGCLEFTVERTDDELVWQVLERFRDTAAFHAHQTRTAESEWGRATKGITRHFTVEGLAPR